MPDLPARQLAQNSLTELPIGVIAPMPVTTTRVPFLPLRPAMLTSVLNRLLTFSPPAHALAPPPQRRANLLYILT